ncbi:hypothetical protein SAMN04488570_2859 [Nocardioides scoriae]|uniref:Uncharacterized protein n=1 Tax=Nocardioides scoriae TaxID=642780 RepID=A0A1H1VKV0_9ACTN|nr:hypothetical protein [Nocardioides scoriae]SDS85150.1 hypothetical protein SAMN04488570_2859 [Nocardioides scoriae]
MRDPHPHPDAGPGTGEGTDCPSGCRARGLRGPVPSAQEAADAVRVAMARGDGDRTFAVVLEVRDRLRDALALREEPALVADAWVRRPTGLEGPWFVLLAVLVHHEFERVNLPPPAWTAAQQLPTAWVLDTPRLTDAEIRDQTPTWLAARNIYIAVKDLGTL